MCDGEQTTEVEDRKVSEKENVYVYIISCVRDYTHSVDLLERLMEPRISVIFMNIVYYSEGMTNQNEQRQRCIWLREKPVMSIQLSFPHGVMHTALNSSCNDTHDKQGCSSETGAQGFYWEVSDVGIRYSQVCY